jgi:hypothetical protein
MLSTDQINDLHRLYWSERWAIRKIERHLKISRTNIDRVQSDYSLTVPRRPVPHSYLSRPSEMFLIEPSRKFLLTALRLKDGTNQDEPRGTRQVGMAETG